VLLDCTHSLAFPAPYMGARLPIYQVYTNMCEVVVGSGGAGVMEDAMMSRCVGSGQCSGQCYGQ
jgi:hypothetical protein